MYRMIDYSFLLILHNYSVTLLTILYPKRGSDKTSQSIWQLTNDQAITNDQYTTMWGPIGFERPNGIWDA